MKRGVDLLLTVAALPLVIPVALVVASLVRVRHGAPVLFTHERAGKDGVPFEMVKFRTMTNARYVSGAAAARRPAAHGPRPQAPAGDEPRRAPRAVETRCVAT